MVDWETVKLPRQMIQRVNEFVETDYAGQNGFTSKSPLTVSPLISIQYVLRGILDLWTSTLSKVFLESEGDAIFLFRR